jgi:hypothetical protein
MPLIIQMNQPFRPPDSKGSRRQFEPTNNFASHSVRIMLEREKRDLNHTHSFCKPSQHAELVVVLCTMSLPQDTLLKAQVHR